MEHRLSATCYIFIPDLTRGFNILHQDNCITRREIFKFWNLVGLILDIWRHSFMTYVCMIEFLHNRTKLLHLPFTMNRIAIDIVNTIRVEMAFFRILVRRNSHTKESQVKQIIAHSRRFKNLPGGKTIYWHPLILFKLLQLILTHRGRVTHICVVKLTIIGSDNGLSHGRRQAIIWTNAGILLIVPLETNFIEILIGIQKFSFKKMHLKVSSAKWRPFCLGLNVLRSDVGRWNLRIPDIEFHVVT